MKTLSTENGECIQYIERCTDGGLIVATLVPTGNGDFFSHRHWYQDPAAARTVYASEKDVGQRVADAKGAGVTGQLISSR